MREIIFRGKRTDNGEWVEGYYIHRPSAVGIGISNPICIWIPAADPDDSTKIFEVSTETVCQFTGLTDKNGRKIFEGDIVNFYNGDGEYSPYEVRWRNSGFSVLMNGKPNLFDELDDFFRSRCDVIGNVFDNPELLEVKQNG